MCRAVPRSSMTGRDSEICRDWHIPNPNLNPHPNSNPTWLLQAARSRPLGLVHFAHTDLSGLSLFEEAVHWGGRAAAEVALALPPV